MRPILTLITFPETIPLCHWKGGARLNGLLKVSTRKKLTEGCANMFLVFASTEYEREEIDDGLVMTLERFFDILEATEDIKMARSF